MNGGFIHIILPEYVASKFSYKYQISFFMIPWNHNKFLIMNQFVWWILVPKSQIMECVLSVINLGGWCTLNGLSDRWHEVLEVWMEARMEGSKSVDFIQLTISGVANETEKYISNFGLFGFSSIQASRARYFSLGTLRARARYLSLSFWRGLYISHLSLSFQSFFQSRDYATWTVETPFAAFVQYSLLWFTLYTVL